MIGLGTLIHTRRGPVLVEDIEGEVIPIPHPTRGYVFAPCGDPICYEGPRTLLMLDDGRDLLVSSTIHLFLEDGGTIEAHLILPGTRLAGGVVEAVSHDAGSLYHLPALEGVPFTVNGITMLG
jgi:hypothetical protein